MVTHQLQVERRTGKVRRPETDVHQLSHATNPVVGSSVYARSHHSVDQTSSPSGFSGVRGRKLTVLFPGPFVGRPPVFLWSRTTGRNLLRTAEERTAPVNGADVNLSAGRDRTFLLPRKSPSRTCAFWLRSLNSRVTVVVIIELWFGLFGLGAMVRG